MLEQKLLNRMLQGYEELFLFPKLSEIPMADSINKMSEYFILQSITDLIILGAVPSNHDAYGEVIKILDEGGYLEQGMCYGAGTEFLIYLNTILDNEPPYVQTKHYAELLNKLRRTLNL